MPTYHTSTTTVSEPVVRRLVADGLAKEWRHPRTGTVRYYIDTDGLCAIIGFEQTTSTPGTSAASTTSTGTATR